MNQLSVHISSVEDDSCLLGQWAFPCTGKDLQYDDPNEFATEKNNLPAEVKEADDIELLLVNLGNGVSAFTENLFFLGIVDHTFWPDRSWGSHTCIEENHEGVFWGAWILEARLGTKHVGSFGNHETLSAGSLASFASAKSIRNICPVLPERSKPCRSFPSEASVFL